MKQKLLKTMLLLCTLIVGSLTSWATDEVLTASTPSISSLPDGWSGNDGGGTSYVKLIASDHYIQTPEFLQNGFTSIVIKARKFGGPSADQALITVSWYSNDVETVLGTVAPTSTTLTNYTISTPTNPTGNTTGYVKIQCKGASSSKGSGVSEVTINYTPGSSGGGTELEDCDLALEGAPVALTFDLYNNSDAQVINYATSSTGAVTVSSSEYIDAEVNESAKTITVTPLKKTASAQTITVNQASDETYATGSVTFTVSIDDSTPKTGAWELIDLADLEESDVFVIVGNNGSTYAMSNNNGTTNPPSAVAVTIENDEITSDVDDNIKWNISGNSTDGYTFYPNGSTTTWLYCTNSNNGVRVGTNDNKTFKIDSDYLKHDATSRYMGVYNSTDWRCYTSNGGNIAGQTFTFYKYVNEVGVKKPVITVPETFIGSTTATITCATDGATIKYSYDGENWSNYSTALTITETKTIYAKAVKDANESDVVSKTTTKTLPTPTIAIDATGITNTDVYVGTDAGSLSASVTYEDTPVEGAAVTWSGNNDEVATINATTGAVTLVAAGSVTFTATYAGNGDYAGNTATYNMTVTNSDPDAPGTENNPYTVAQARAAIDAGSGVTGVYVTGIVCEGGSNLSSGALNYWISDDGTETNKFEIYKGKGVDGASFSATTDVQVGDVVVVTGNLTKYNTTYEFSANSQLVSLKRKPATPTFSPVAGAVASGTTVTISCATEGAVIYYTMGETPADPTTSSTVYSAPIEITEATTIKAIAVKDELTSDVATASYTINVTPSINVAETTVNAPAAGKDGIIEVTYNNITSVDAEVQFVEADGTTPATYDWVVASINGDNNVKYVIEANALTEARTAYMKVYALDDEANDVYSELITINQEEFVIDFATLPFAWNGGTKEDLTTESGVTASGLGSNYAESNAPYRVKLDSDDDYIQVKTDCQPVMVSLDVKMLGGGNTSTITVQESADGDTFTDVEDLTIEGALNTVLYLQTGSAFDAATRYVRFVFNKGKGSNVGVGGITIEKAFDDAVIIGTAGFTSYVTKHNVSFPVGADAYIVTSVDANHLKMTKTDSAPKGTAVVIGGDAGTYTLAPVSSPAAVAGNLLKASDGTVTGASGRYVLANKSYGVGFYRVSDPKITIPAGKAYLEVGAGVKEFYLFSFDEEETGLKDLKDLKDLNDVIYNLSGQRISKLQKGINIVNGKKVLF